MAYCVSGVVFYLISTPALLEWPGPSKIDMEIGKTPFKGRFHPLLILL